MRLLVCGFAIVCCANAQNAPATWVRQESHSTASLRGVHSLGGGVAWASGASGTVLRTIDGGDHWTACAVPAGAEKLDFRAIQAFDADSAIAMSAGTGDLSKLFKTTDGCRTWKLVLANPDAKGFWDGLRFIGRVGVLIGDPVDGAFPLFVSIDGGETWKRRSAPAAANQSLFAASNTSLLTDSKSIYFVTGGVAAFIADGVQTPLPLASGEAAGGFSLASRGDGVFVAVGGDYKKPDETAGTAVFRGSDGIWHAAEVPPHGYRSAVAYDSARKSWIAVGPNGTDISADDGRTWKPLPDAEKNWNAVSLPLAVGSRGRIGKLAP